MKCRILHESRGRMRVRVLKKHMTCAEADRLQYYLMGVDGVRSARVSERSCDAVILYEGARERVVGALSRYDSASSCGELPEHTGRELRRKYEDRLFFLILRRAAGRLLLPVSLGRIIIGAKAVRHISKGVRCLMRGRLEVPVLDAVTIAVSLIRSDFRTAGSVMFLLDAGELLEEWTHRKSVDDLASRMMLDADQVWVPSGDTEVLVPVHSVQPGDAFIVRTGNLIPLDGIVVSGEAEVNESTMTGEALPVHKEDGSAVFAGTVLEDGELKVRVTQGYGAGRYDRIVSMIETSEKLKSQTESRAAHIADSLVPVSLGGTLLLWLISRNVTKSLSILMVDFSCALKLAMPISVLSAMRECAEHKISVKGGKFLEAAAEAETIVFDKTGTLTCATPRVRKVVAFGGRDETEMLRIAACLEEHFPHSIANAVVKEAVKRGIEHDEMHAKVEYIVAHGIVSRIGDKRALIGSRHFVFEDEKCSVPEADRNRFRRLPSDCSLLYLALDGELAAVVCIEDPIREEAASVIRELHALGVNNIVMMTGDSRRTAKTVAGKLGLDAYYAEVLPEDKAGFIRSEREKGHKVIMVGDGVNDSPALSEADVGIAVSAGAAIAREVADITVGSDDLRGLVTLRKISMALMGRIRGNYRKIMTFNGGLIGFGAAGMLQPATSALLHNMSTIAFSLQSMTDLLSGQDAR